MRFLWLAVGVLLGSAACSGVPMSSETPSYRPTFPRSTAGPVAPTGTAASVPPEYLAAIVADLAGRGVNDTPTVESAEEVTWPDGSLGCPSPGAVYTQSLVEGMRVVVSADGRTWDYRFGTTSRPVLCAS